MVSDLRERASSGGLERGTGLAVAGLTGRGWWWRRGAYTPGVA
jgi:hypothetical protein